MKRFNRELPRFVVGEQCITTCEIIVDRVLYSHEFKRYPRYFCALMTHETSWDMLTCKETASIYENNDVLWIRQHEIGKVNCISANPHYRVHLLGQYQHIPPETAHILLEHAIAAAQKMAQAVQDSLTYMQHVQSQITQGPPTNNAS